MPRQLLAPGRGDGKYLAFLGRVSPEKGLEEAIEIACRSGMQLKIAAKVDQADLEYYESRIEPLLNNKLIDFVGEIGHDEKSDFLGNAAALLFPIQWPEPFGIVMIEALACGTPVIAFRRGSESLVSSLTTQTALWMLCNAWEKSNVKPAVSISKGISRMREWRLNI
jgi:glycosyltransferase involved in cell wall biosynthesis